MRILIVTDAWLPQVNGVVNTLRTVTAILKDRGHEIDIVTPDGFRTVPCPSYPEIRLAVFPSGALGRRIDRFQPDAIHITTEGPLGLAARNHCVKQRLPFSTSFLSRFPEYIHARTRIPTALSYAVMRWFHRPAAATMVASQSMEDILVARGFRNLKRWSRGVDTALFRPSPKHFLADPRPILLYVGRVAVEKNIEAFLSLDFPGTKYVVGGGPQLPSLKQKYPRATFVGPKFGEELAQYYAASDVLVFPSKTDVFGNVQLEALASGVPVAAFPVVGSSDILSGSGAGVLDNDLKVAVERALDIPPEICRQHALRYSWHESAEQFLGNLASIRETVQEEAETIAAAIPSRRLTDTTTNAEAIRS